MVEARNFKFGTETDGVSSNAKKCKIRSKGVMCGSRDPLLEFWHSLLSGEWLKLNFIFGNENDGNIIYCINNAVTGSFLTCSVIQVKHSKLKFYLECHIHFVRN